MPSSGVVGGMLRGWLRLLKVLVLEWRRPTSACYRHERASVEQPGGRESAAATPTGWLRSTARGKQLALGLAVKLHHAAHLLPDERREAGEGEDGRGLQLGGGDLELLKEEARGGERQTTLEGPKAGVHSRAREVRAAALARARVVSQCRGAVRKEGAAAVAKACGKAVGAARLDHRIDGVGQEVRV